MKFKSNIDKLKVLTESLIDRDYVRSKVVELFDRFCSDFPVQMDAWIVDRDFSVTSKKGQIIRCSAEKLSLDKIFEGDARDKNIQMHKKAFLGESVVYILNVDDRVLLTKVMPANSTNDLVFGFSMDVTSFADISDAFHLHCENDKDKSGCELISKVKSDKLYRIIREEA